MQTPVIQDPDEVVERLDRGEVFIYPTDTAYGIGCSINFGDSIRRVFRIKERDTGKPVPTLLHESTLDRLVDPTEPERRAIETFWPGALTLVFELKDALRVSELLRSGDTMALRDPGFEFLRTILKHAGPIVGTSANISGEETAYTLKQVSEEVLDRVDFVAGGQPAGSDSSTVAQWDRGDGEWMIHREGPVTGDELRESTNTRELDAT